MKKRVLKTLALFLAALTLCLTAFPAAAAESATAATMQLMKTEGTVDVTNGSGRSLTKRDNMRLYNGYHVKTGAASYAWVDLDSTKLTKLDAVSEVEVRGSGKKLELLLSSGNLFFNVTRPLEERETLNVRTATMVVGIRGTCGWLKVNDRWSTEICVLEGTVQCNVTDPVTGQVKTASVQGGEKAIATVYPQDQAGDKCDIIQERLEPDDIGGFVLEELVRDPDLCDAIYEASGLDVQAALETAQERLEQDQQEMQEMLDRIGNQQAQQDSGVSTGPVWEQETPAASTPPSTPPSGGGSDDRDDRDDRDDSGSGGVTDESPAEEQPPAGGSPGGGDVTPPARRTVTLTMPNFTADEVQANLDDPGVSAVFLDPGTAGEPLVFSSGLVVPPGKSLTISEGIDIHFSDGCSLTIDSAGAVDNNGTLEAPSIENNGALINQETGRIIVTGILTTADRFASKGAIEGTVSHIGGDTEITGGTIDGGDGTAVSISGGTFTMNEGEIISSSTATVHCEAGGKLEFAGGKITNSGDGAALSFTAPNPEDFVTFGGTVFWAKANPVITADGAHSFVPRDYIETTETVDDITWQCLKRDDANP